MSRRSSELASVMGRVLRAFAERDEETVRSLISQSDETLLIGSDADEWLYGFEAYEVASAQAGETEYSLTVHRIEAHEDGSVGWAAAESTATFEDGFHADIRITAVFRLEAGIWRVVQWHASLPSSFNERATRRVTTSLAQLLDGLGDDAERALRARFQTTTKAFLFTDIEGSTAHSAAAGDAVWSDGVRRHFAEIERIATAHDGTVVKTLGDGTMVVFERAVDAIRAAGDIQRSVRRQAASRPFRVRVGVHNGESIHLDGDYLGTTVNTAARLADAAAGGEVLVSTAALDAADSVDIRTGDPRELELAGISGTITARLLVTE